MVLECAFLQMVKGTSHVPDECWMRVLSFLPDRDVASVSASSSRLHRLAVAFRKAPVAASAVKQKEAAAQPAPVAAAPVASAAVAAKEDPVEEVKGGLFSRNNKTPKSSGSGTFSLRKLKKK